MSVDLILIIFAALLVSWIIGANSVATTFGPVAGSGSSGILRGALLAGVFGLLGAVTQGGYVASTVGSELLSGLSLSALVGGIVLLMAAALVLVGVFSNIPTPIAFTVVGGILGAGLGLGAFWNISKIQIIAITWLLIPLIAIPMGYLLSKVLRSFTSSRESKGALNVIAFLIGSFAAYTAGANLVGLAIGPLNIVLDVSLELLLLTGGVFILLGSWFGGPRIVNAVSREYSEMGTRRATCALATAAILAQAATIFGIPVSFNEAVIASIIGSGLVAGKENIELKKITKTGGSWIMSFLLSISLVYIITITLQSI